MTGPKCRAGVVPGVGRYYTWELSGSGGTMLFCQPNRRERGGTPWHLVTYLHEGGRCYAEYLELTPESARSLYALAGDQVALGRALAALLVQDHISRISRIQALLGWRYQPLFAEEMAIEK